MALYDQPVTSYDDTTAQVRVISDVIRLIDPIDTPLLAALGGLDGARGKFDVRENGKKIELLEDSYMTMSGLLATDMAHDTTTADVTDGSIYQAGMILKIQDEYVVVTSASATDNTIGVTERAYGGTNATHTSTNGTITIVGMAREEGDDASFVGLQALVAPFNYTQILEKALNVSGTNEAIDYYGMSSPFAYQAKKAIPELLRLIELGLFHGIRDVGNGATQPRSFGGLGTFITSNTSNTTALAKVYIDNVSQYCFEDGGNPDLMVVNPEIAKDLKALLDSSSFVRVDQSGGQFGMRPITYVETQFGTHRLIVSRWCPLATTWFLESSKIGLYTLRPFAWKPLAMTGDSKKGEVVGEFSFLIANGAGMGSINTLT